MVKGQITFESFETTPYYRFIIQVYTLNAETLVKKVGQLNEEELKKMRRNIALILGFII